MRIFLSCQQSRKTHPVPAYQFWETYFKKGIEEAGSNWCEASEIDWAGGLVYTDEGDLAAWRERVWDKALAELRAQHQRQPIDLFLSYLFPKQVDYSAVREIQHLGIPCVNFFCDNVREFVRVPECFRAFDLHWVPEFKALKMYRTAGLSFVHAPMPMWVLPEYRVWEHPENYGVSFIGSRDILREALLASVLEHGVSLEIRGTGWEENGTHHMPRARGITKTLANQIMFMKEQGGKAWIRKLKARAHARPTSAIFSSSIRKKPDASEYIEITQQSVVTLGINRYPSFRRSLATPDTYSRLRDLEAPMLGACYLTEWTEGLDELYELGAEIETYCNAEEMADKIERLKADRDKRLALRRNGQRRALAEHTVARTLAKLNAAL